MVKAKMVKTLQLTIFCVMLSVALSVLPPGFEDEIYCPGGMCLRKRSDNLHGYKTGARTMFVECFDKANNKTCRPRAWGEKLDIEYKESLLKDHWHTGECEEKRDVVMDYMLLGTRLDSVVERLATLQFL